MQIIVKTKSGSIYCFKEYEGKTRVTRNYAMEGVLERPVEIVPGKALKINFYKCNSYDYSISKELSYWLSTPVESIEILG